MQLNRFMPSWDVRSAHETLVDAGIKATYAALCATNFADSTVICFLLRVRSLGRTLPPRKEAGSLIENLSEGGFLPLAIEPEREVIFGIAGRFWLPTAERIPLQSVEEFDGFERNGYAKAAWNLSLQVVGTGQTRLRTQTRIKCYGAATRLKFRLYWGLVGPFSGLIRLALLRQVKRAAESPDPPAAAT